MHMTSSRPTNRPGSHPGRWSACYVALTYVAEGPADRRRKPDRRSTVRLPETGKEKFTREL